MTMTFYRQISAATSVRFPLFKKDTPEELYTNTPVISLAWFQLNIDGVSQGAPNNIPQLENNQAWRLDLDVAEMAGKQIVVRYRDITTNVILEDMLVIETFGSEGFSQFGFPAQLQFPTTDVRKTGGQDVELTWAFYPPRVKRYAINDAALTPTTTEFEATLQGGTAPPADEALRDRQLYFINGPAADAITFVQEFQVDSGGGLSYFKVPPLHVAPVAGNEFLVV